ncbi:MAG: putative sulfate exporter family transporter [Pseudomonadota bacterium]
MSAVLPGLLLAVAIALTGQAAAHALGAGLLGGIKSPISATLLAIVIGMLIRNLLPFSPRLSPGISFALKRILRLGIVLLGIRLSLADLGTIGIKAVPVAVITVSTALVLTTWLGARVGVPRRLGTLIAVGTGVCGTTAIMASAPAIGARDDEVCYAVACITLFGLVAMLAYPFAAHAIFDGDTLRVGVFLGTSVHDTAQVAGAGLVYQQVYQQPAALEAATVTKLVRNLGMLVVIPLMSVWYQRSGEDVHAAKKWYQMVPLFVIGFALMSLLRTAGDAMHVDWSRPELWTDTVGYLKTAATFCLTVAMAAVGLGTDLSTLRDTGFRPLAVGLASALMVGVVSVLMIHLWL